MKMITGCLVFILLATSTGAFGGEVKFIDRHNLAGLLDSPDVAIFDVRTAKDWNFSEYKIKNAVHLTGDMMESTMNTVPKDKMIVFYCA